MSTQIENPFAPPECRDGVAEVLVPPQFRRISAAWILVFLLNVPVPALLGWKASSKDNEMGMVMGCAALLLAGLWITHIRPRMIETVSIGGLLTALTQFYPFLQAWVGVASVMIVRRGQVQFYRKNLESMFQVTLATLLTGMGLIFCSWIFGLLLKTVYAMTLLRPSNAETQPDLLSRSR